MTRLFISRPLAWIPIVMSLAALGLVLGYLALFGIVHNADEGLAAHLWQLLMAGQIPIILIFVIKYLFQEPKQTIFILVIQIIAALLACAPVFLLEL